jgi:hypothetical protein
MFAHTGRLDGPQCLCFWRLGTVLGVVFIAAGKVTL